MLVTKLRKSKLVTNFGIEFSLDFVFRTTNFVRNHTCGFQFFIIISRTEWFPFLCKLVVILVCSSPSFGSRLDIINGKCVLAVNIFLYVAELGPLLSKPFWLLVAIKTSQFSLLKFDMVSRLIDSPHLSRASEPWSVILFSLYLKSQAKEANRYDWRESDF